MQTKVREMETRNRAESIEEHRKFYFTHNVKAPDSRRAINSEIAANAIALGHPHQCGVVKFHRQVAVFREEFAVPRYVGVT